MAFRSSATAFTNSGGVSLTATPAGVAAHDVLVGVLLQDSNGHGIATPSGWTIQYNQSVSAPDTQQLQYYEKLDATGSDSFTTGIVLDANAARLTTSAFTGRNNAGTPARNYAEKNTTTSSPATISTANATNGGTVGVGASSGDDTFMFVGINQEAATDVWSQTTNPTGSAAYTERQDNANDWINLAYATCDNVAGGGEGSLSAVHTRSVGSSGCGWQVVTVALPAAGGTTYNVSASESTAASEASSAIAAFLRTVVEAAAGTETSNAVRISTDAVTESAAAAESSNAAAGFVVDLTESVSATETQDGTLGAATYNEAVAESTASGETQSSAHVVSDGVSETTTATESSSSGAVLVGAATESVTATDAASSLATLVAVGSEAAAATEIQIGTTIFPAAAAEAVTASESPSASLARVGAISEAATASESTSAAVSLTGAVNEGVTGTDSQNAQAAFGGVVAESISAIETQSTIANLVASITEAVTATDSCDVTYVQLVVGQYVSFAFYSRTATMTAASGRMVDFSLAARSLKIA